MVLSRGFTGALQLASLSPLQSSFRARRSKSAPGLPPCQATGLCEPMCGVKGSLREQARRGRRGPAREATKGAGAGRPVLPRPRPRATSFPLLPTPRCGQQRPRVHRRSTSTSLRPGRGGGSRCAGRGRGSDSARLPPARPRGGVGRAGGAGRVPREERSQGGRTRPAPGAAPSRAQAGTRTRPPPSPSAGRSHGDAGPRGREGRRRWGQPCHAPALCLRALHST